MQVWICCSDSDCETKKVVSSEEKAAAFVAENVRDHWYHGPYDVED